MAHQLEIKSSGYGLVQVQAVWNLIASKITIWSITSISNCNSNCNGSGFQYRMYWKQALYWIIQNIYSELIKEEKKNNVITTMK